MNRTHSPILVMGASGLVGRQVVEQLQRSGYRPRRATRRPSSPDDVPLDLRDRSTHAAALAGMHSVMLISRPGDEDADRHAEPLIAAMDHAGVQRVVVLSALGAAEWPEFSVRKVERLVERSGMRWVHVRPNFFMQMLAQPPLCTEIASLGTLSLPLAQAKVAYVDAADVAAVLVRALIDERLDGSAIPVSGPQAWDHDALARIIGRWRGESVRYVDLSDETARQLLQARGFPEAHRERVLRFYTAVRLGLCARPDQGEAASVLGRPLADWETVMRAHTDAWRRAAAATTP